MVRAQRPSDPLRMPASSGHVTLAKGQSLSEPPFSHRSCWDSEAPKGTALMRHGVASPPHGRRSANGVAGSGSRLQTPAFSRPRTPSLGFWTHRPSPSQPARPRPTPPGTEGAGSLAHCRGSFVGQTHTPQPQGRQDCALWGPSDVLLLLQAASSGVPR